jgi:preprotein translocase subunit SecE
MKKIIDFVKESYIELRKVTWPSRQQVINYTVVVIFISVAVAFFLGSLDMTFSYVIKKFLL